MITYYDSPNNSGYDFPVLYGREFDRASGCPMFIDDQVGIVIPRDARVEIVPTLSPKFDIVTDDLVDRLWEKMTGRPVIVPCPYCYSHNAVANPTCVQCGGPLGV